MWTTSFATRSSGPDRRTRRGSGTGGLRLLAAITLAALAALLAVSLSIDASTVLMSAPV
jgi:hypothetical protein